MEQKRVILGAEIGEQILALSCHPADQETVVHETVLLEGTGEEEISEKIKEFLKNHELGECVNELVYLCDAFPLSKCKKMERFLISQGIGQGGMRRISRENAFVHYVMGQDEALHRHTVLLFDFDGQTLMEYRLFHPKKKTPKEMKTETKKIGSFQLIGDSESLKKRLDQQFAEAARQLLTKEVVSAVFLTGQGFEGDWMKESLKVLCDGRRAFFGQNLYSGGCCYYGSKVQKDGPSEYWIQAPETVLYEAGVLDGAAGDSFVRITEAGAPWYETKGSLDVILERGNKVDLVFVDSQTKEKQVESVELSGIPMRPRKTGRLCITVEFTDSKKGVIFVGDKGFGEFSPATHQVFIKEFTLI